MGILLEDANELMALGAKTRFKKVLSLGRQHLHFNPSDLLNTLEKANCANLEIAEFLQSTGNGGPAEPLFKLIGSEITDSMDFSEYEGATIIHDLNSPIPEKLNASYDLVYDGGTLEHIFNFPTAIANAMKMVKPGGYLILSTPGNNQMGHGFYQFSPELFFNILSDDNGYKIEKMLAIEISPTHRKFLVANPSEVKERVTLSNSWPVELFVIAKRYSVVPLFRRSPQQSDYERAWKGQESGTSMNVNSSPNSVDLSRRLKNLSLRIMPGPIGFLTSFKKVFLDRNNEFRKGNHFREVD